MKRELTKTTCKVWHIKDGIRREGPPSDVRGDLSRVSGDLTNVRGNLSGVSGNLSGVSGDLSGVRGDLTGVSGDLDDCAITQSDRDRGIDISELFADDAK